MKNVTTPSLSSSLGSLIRPPAEAAARSTEKQSSNRQQLLRDTAHSSSVSPAAREPDHQVNGDVGDHGGGDVPGRVPLTAAPGGIRAQDIVYLIIHKNIVRLIGCCLEVDSPMLVYEFIPKGSMDDILHGMDKKPLNLDVRLNIALESAQGLAYMHSQTNTIILHGDVKPANILLNDEFAPKISDFGISRLIATDKEHTALVIGDRSYMDPVYLQTGRLTAKSDVYGFGVVILELISRKKATYSDDNSLVKSFLDVHKDRKKSTELFDPEIAVEGNLDLLESLAGIAVDCLNLDVDQRPTMTDVAERLVILKRSR